MEKPKSAWGSDTYSQKAETRIGQALAVLRDLFSIGEQYTDDAHGKTLLFMLDLAKVPYDERRQAIIKFYTECAAMANVYAKRGWVWHDEPIPSLLHSDVFTDDPNLTKPN